ncbi:tyrosine-type recombinase/integrase [Arthrobacter sp. NPDC056727]|uniref:tyrosine-type recombinase/integrase n=1 Tax=Arthrobacter sp. NPDC056727 TaxID=3345927 RepID=UPI003670799A
MDWIDSRHASDSPRGLPDVDLPKFGRVTRTTDHALPWRVAGLPAAHDGIVIDDFLVTLSTNDCSPQTLRSYAYDLMRWWRFLAAIGNRWDTARREDVRDLVLWMRQPQDPGGRRAYRPASINHMLSVLSVFYEHQARQGQGPVANPVPASASGVRRHAHHNPLDSHRPQHRAPYRQRLVEGPPKALSEDLVNRVFMALTSTRDRALVAMYLATGARASELLGMRGLDVDWGNQSIGVVSKGTRAYQWVPTSPDSLTWLRLYLNETPMAPTDEALWWTLRRLESRPSLGEAAHVLQVRP